MNKKSQIWISAVLYILITVVVMVIILEAGTPILRNLKDETIFTQTKDNFVSLSQHIEDVGSSGPGTQRVIPIEVRKGDLAVGNNKLKWEMETKAPMMESGSSIELGNLKISADTDVDAYESGESFIMENRYLLANFTRIGDSENITNLTTSELINHLVFKKDDIKTDGTFSFEIENNHGEGEGYTELLDEGYDLESATFMAYINDAGFEYKLYITLKSNSDYLIINIEEINIA